MQKHPIRHETQFETPLVVAESSPSDAEFTLMEHPLDDVETCRATEWYRDWLNIFEQDHQSSVFQHPDFVLNEVRYKPESPDRPLVLVKYTDDSGISALAILVPKNFESRLFFNYMPKLVMLGYRLAGSRLIGACDESAQRTILRAIGKILQQLPGRFVLAEDVEPSASVWQLLKVRRGHDLTRFQLKPLQPKHRICFDLDLEEYRLGFSRRARKEFKRILNKNKNSEMRKFTRPEEVSELLEAAHRISRNSWQANVYGVRVNNDEAERRQLTFLAEQGYLRSYLLYHRGVPIAFEIGYQKDGYMYGIEAGFDVDYAKLSPGNVLMHWEIEDLFAENPPEWYDFGEGDAPYKQRFSNHTSASAPILLVTRETGSFALLAIYWMNTRLESAIRALLDALGLKARIRSIYRRIGKQPSDAGSTQ